MFLRIFLSALLVYFLLRIYRISLQIKALNRRAKQRKHPEGKTVIYKIPPKKKALKIDAETIDFEEIKEN